MPTRDLRRGVQSGLKSTSRHGWTVLSDPAIRGHHDMVVLVSVRRLLFGRNPAPPALASALTAGFVGALVFGLTAPFMFDRSFRFTFVLAFPLAAVTRGGPPRALRWTVGS